jgi:glyceraldehyde 3-phosphate dehydrogenase
MNQIKVGINGFGRIGKCVFIQLLSRKNFSICCLNVTGLKIKDIEEYLLYDSTHHYDKNFKFEIISESEFILNEHKIKLFSDREPKNLPWRNYGCEYLFECTGSFLTKEKCLSHDIDYVIMSAPAKDSTPTFIYGVNSEKYSGENIISGSSCTTNCLAPFLKLVNDSYKINDCVFTTIHATTASQYTVDIVDKKARTSRSILNNIIPHTTGASASIYSVLPELSGLINGTSLRVPVLNCSLLDVNIQFENKQVVLKDIIQLIKSNQNYKIVYDVNDKNLVSCDFVTTITPTILDSKASIDMGLGKFKFFLWYDNEWSYSTQLIRICELMWNHNNKKNYKNNGLDQKYNISNIDFRSKNVVLRLDLNVPMKNSAIMDDFRISSAIPTINTILNSNPARLIITSHFGRPNGWDLKYSLNNILENLKKYIEQVEFLPHGISYETLNQLSNSQSKIFLLENLRFHSEETDYEKTSPIDKTNSLDKSESNEIIDIYSKLGDIFISDAFGCTHRNHMSIGGIKQFEQTQNKTIGYGHLINKEISYLKNLICSDKKILCIIGGNKISDKLPIIDSFKNLQNAKIFVGGGLAKHYTPDTSNTVIMEDGWGNDNLDKCPEYILDIKTSSLNAYDVGPKSKLKLFDMVLESDIVFWNGSLGVIENDIYKKSSLELVKFLESNKQITTIIGGGETGSIVTDKNSNIYVSTGGGALLEYLENQFKFNKNTPGIEIYTS